MRIEREIAFVTMDTAGPREVRLQASFVAAFADLRPSLLLVLKTVVTTPLVAPDGRVIAKCGFDRATGAFFDLSPQELAAVPESGIDDSGIKAAYQLLRDQLLVDVAADATSKAVAVAMLCTVIEAPLLPERPAFFVCAPQRGGGKTTLLHMSAYAVFNRAASAAAWSEHREERRKTILAIAVEGHRMVLFDNIPRGTTITCPEIEKLLTSEEISDRVLGESRTGTASARIVIVFTGNNIEPAGDMASRSLKIIIDPGRPDPENRDFAHPAPIAWVQANRPQLLGALLTILSGNPALRRRRDPSFQPETRFKTWWALVGSAIEYAASLCGDIVSFKDLFKENEEYDDGAAGLAELLDRLKRMFEGQPFTAKQVAEKINRSADGCYSGDPDLLDALVRATGTSLKLVTAHSIGLRFRSIRRRPTFLGEEIWCLDLDENNAENKQAPSTWAIVRVNGSNWEAIL